MRARAREKSGVTSHVVRPQKPLPVVTSSVTLLSHFVRDVNKARTLEAEARTLEAETRILEAEATKMLAPRGLEAEARPGSLTLPACCISPLPKTER